MSIGIGLYGHAGASALLQFHGVPAQMIIFLNEEFYMFDKCVRAFGFKLIFSSCSFFEIFDARVVRWIYSER